MTRIVCSIRWRGISALTLPPCYVCSSMTLHGDTVFIPKFQDLRVRNGCISDWLSNAVRVNIGARETGLAGLSGLSCLSGESEDTLSRDAQNAGQQGRRRSRNRRRTLWGTLRIRASGERRWRAFSASCPLRIFVAPWEE